MLPPSHGETASAVHAWEVQTSFRSRPRAQRATAALQSVRVLQGGPDLAGEAAAYRRKRGCSQPPCNEFVGRKNSPTGAAAVGRGNKSLWRAGW